MKLESIPIDWNAGLSIYASQPFLKAVSDECGWLGGMDEAGALRCILPYTIVKKGPFRMVRFRTETIWLKEEIPLDEEKKFLNKVVDFFRSTGADIIIPATTNAIFRTFPDGALAAPYGTFIVDLSQAEESLLSGLHSSHRRKLRLARKEGVEVRSGIEYLDVAYQLVRDTFKRSQMGFMDYEAFTRYICGLKDNVKILVAEHGGTVQGCVVVPFSNHCAYYVYGGSIPEPVAGATTLLHWEAMRLLRGLGVKQYDFVGVRINPEEGSKQAGLTQYKRGFGGRLVQGYMWKCALHPLKYVAYAAGVRFLRGGDIVDQERHKLESV
jgi:hypothetical protein